MAVRVSQAQLERAVGGAASLLRLIDKDGTGDLGSATCQAFINEILDEAHGDVDGYIGMGVNLSDPSIQTAPMLVRYEIARAAYLAWMKGTGGMAMPDGIRTENDNALAECEKIGARKKGVGLATQPGTSQAVEQITDDGTRDYYNPQGPRRRFDGWS